MSLFAYYKINKFIESMYSVEYRADCLLMLIRLENLNAYKHTGHNTAQHRTAPLPIHWHQCFQFIFNVIFSIHCWFKFDKIKANEVERERTERREMMWYTWREKSYFRDNTISINATCILNVCRL